MSRHEMLTRERFGRTRPRHATHPPRHSLPAEQARFTTNPWFRMG
jgi:hypothetical protein